jgi:hypothetical protein
MKLQQRARDKAKGGAAPAPEGEQEPSAGDAPLEPEASSTGGKSDMAAPQ